MQPIAKSRKEANAIKRGEPITVVIGNPPYKNKAAGLGGWIECGSAGRDAPLERWAPPREWGVGAHTHHLKNLYVYFWRWATWKVFGIGLHASTGLEETDKVGIVCFITVAGFLNGPGFEKMRDDLRRSCHDIWVIDCSPEGHQPDIPTRIFQAVQQPVCIVLAARALDKDSEVAARVRFHALPEGRREEKFTALETLSLKDTQWTDCPSGWRDPFLPAHDSVWASFPDMSELFVWSGSGVTPHRTWPIAPDVWSLERRWEALKQEKDIAKQEMLFHPDRDRQIDSLVTVDLGLHVTRPISVAQDQGDLIPPVRYAFRSFDRQWVPPDNRLLSMPWPQLWAG